MTQNGKGDFTLLYNGQIYKFPTESERWEFLMEEAKNDDLGDTIITDFMSVSGERKSIS